MKILVTGGAGFVGYHIVKRLLDRGEHVVIIDNMLDNNDLDLKKGRLAKLGINSDSLYENPEQYGRNNLRMLLLDVRDRDTVCELCIREQFDVIYHFAALTGKTIGEQQPELYYDINVTGTANMLEAARVGGVNHFFYASSSAVYGDTASVPLQEEDDVDRPMGLYASSKRMSELMCYTYARNFNIMITVFRFFAVYGSWCRKDSAPMQLALDIINDKEIRLLNNGNLTRDFTYIDDVTDVLESALVNPPYSDRGVPYQLFNIGRSKPVPYLSFIHAIEAALGKEAKLVRSPLSPLSIGERVSAYADTSKLERILAYSPVWDYEAGLPIFIDWFNKNYTVTFNI